MIAELHGWTRSVLCPLGGLLLAASAAADLDDGQLLGATTILSSGDPAVKFDIVFVGDGFTASEQTLYRNKVSECCAAIVEAHPFGAVRNAFNLHRVDVASTESGIDVPEDCDDGLPFGASPQERSTAMDTTFCGGSGTTFRCVGTPDPSLVDFWAGQVPSVAPDVVVVLVNTTLHGGCRRASKTYVSLHGGMARTVVHELGHALANLGDEYNDLAGENTNAVSRPNLTTEDERENVPWRDLVLDGTPVVTRVQPDCSATGVPGRTRDRDIVGLFEGGNRRACDVYRSQWNCKMRQSGEAFCAVCRRALLRELAPRLSSGLAVSLDDLLVRDASEPWWRGDGEISLIATLASSGGLSTVRWPTTGSRSFSDGQTRSIGKFMAVIPDPFGSMTATLSALVTEADWPDGDDLLTSPATVSFVGPGTVTIDSTDYRLRAEARATGLRVLLDTLHVKDDHDGWLAGAGDVYVLYTISNGVETVSGRWPESGTVGIASGETRDVEILAGAIPRPTGGANLSIRLRVRDADGFFGGSDDTIGDDTFTFGSGAGFGANDVVHVRDRGDYRFTFSVVANP